MPYPLVIRGSLRLILDLVVHRLPGHRQAVEMGYLQRAHLFHFWPSSFLHALVWQQSRDRDEVTVSCESMREGQGVQERRHLLGALWENVTCPVFQCSQTAFFHICQSETVYVIQSWPMKLPLMLCACTFMILRWDTDLLLFLSFRILLSVIMEQYKAESDWVWSNVVICWLGYEVKQTLIGWL